MSAIHCNSSSECNENQNKVHEGDDHVHNIDDSFGKSNNDDVWDALILFDGHHDSGIEQGREEGRQAGHRLGLESGRHFGQIKGLEYGMELGFIQGVVQQVVIELQDCDDVDKSKNYNNKSKIIKTCQDLQHVLNEFPSPHHLFASTRDNNMNTCAQEADTNVVDVRHVLQRIRARFKLLTVQLRMPHFSLQKIMDEEAVDTPVMTKSTTTNSDATGAASNKSISNDNIKASTTTATTKTSATNRMDW